MPVYLPTAVLGNEQTLLTLGPSGEVMGWFHPHKDHTQNVYQCLPCIYFGDPGQGRLSWSWGDEWRKEQHYVGDTNVLETRLVESGAGLEVTFTDVVPPDSTVLVRQIELRNIGGGWIHGGSYLFGDWNMGGIRVGNSLIFSRGSRILLQSHRENALAAGGSALETWQCAKAGQQWSNNALYALQDGRLHCQDLEIGDVNWAFGFHFGLNPGESVKRTLILAMGSSQREAQDKWSAAWSTSFDEHRAAREAADAQWLAPGLAALREASAATPGEAEDAALPDDLLAAYKRSLLCLPLLCGEEGVAVAAPEFDPEFISCGGYGYFWPRDGAEYVSGLIDAGYPEVAPMMFDWCARHQDDSGLWHQRYFLNGEPGPNWCLPPDMLQIDQVGAVLWGYGKWHCLSDDSAPTAEHRAMIRKAADYLLTRQTERGVHGNAFDTWETFVGSFTYSNAAIYAAFRTAASVLGDEKYSEAARRTKEGVLKHFVRDDHGYPYLTRGFNAATAPDETVDSASLGAIEPFGLLDLHDPRDFEIAIGTLRAVTERLEVDWMGGRAIRRFEGDAYVGGVPACVNTLWMARCCLHVASYLRTIRRDKEADELAARAQGYLSTVLRRATPTGLLPELMQGPTGQSYWAAPHGWAMSSFISAALMLARQPRRD